MANNARLRANAKYDKKAYKKYGFRLRREEEKELIEHIEKQTSKNDYFKQLIINDIKNK